MLPLWNLQHLRLLLVRGGTKSFCASLWVFPRTKLWIPKGSLAQFWLLITFIPFLLGNPEGSLSKTAIKVHYVKYKWWHSILSEYVIILYLLNVLIYVHYMQLLYWCVQVEHMKTLDCEVMYTVVKKNDHYCGGTNQGISYLQRKIPWLPYSFMGSLSRPSNPVYHTYKCYFFTILSVLGTFLIGRVTAGHKDDTVPSLHARVESSLWYVVYDSHYT